MLSKGVVYYSDCRLDPLIAEACQRQLLRAINGLTLVSVSLKPLDFGDNYVLGLERGWLTMFRQILTGISHCDEDVVFLVEHDCAYPRQHFDFCPTRKDKYFYNGNFYKLDSITGKAITYQGRSLSGLCADRRLLIDHFQERVARVEREGFKFRNGFEPGTRSIAHSGYDDFKAETWYSEVPYIDIRHRQNSTKSLWAPSEFRNAKSCLGFQSVGIIPGWGQTLGRAVEFIEDIKEGRVLP